MRIKKLIFLSLLSMAFGLTACGGTTTTNGDTGEENSSNPDGKGDTSLGDDIAPSAIYEGDGAIFDTCQASCTGGAENCICDPVALCETYRDGNTSDAVCLGAPSADHSLGILNTSDRPAVVSNYLVYCDGAEPTRVRESSTGCVINSAGHGSIDLIPDYATLTPPDAGPNNVSDVFHPFVGESAENTIDGKTVSVPVESGDTLVRFCSKATVGTEVETNPILREYFVDAIENFKQESFGEGGAPAFGSDHLLMLNGTAPQKLSGFEGGTIYTQVVSTWGEDPIEAIVVPWRTAKRCSSGCISGDAARSGISDCAEDVPLADPTLLGTDCPEGFTTTDVDGYSYCVNDSFCGGERVGLQNQPFCGTLPMGVTGLEDWKTVGMEDPRYHPMNMGELITANAERTQAGEFFSGDGEGYSIADIALWCNAGQLAESNPVNDLGGAYTCTQARTDGEIGTCSFGREFSRQDGNTRDGVATCGYSVRGIN